MVPDTSRPGRSDAPGGGAYEPARCRQSGRLTPAAATRINTSPGFGCGTARVATRNPSGPPGRAISTTCIESATGDGIDGPLHLSLWPYIALKRSGSQLEHTFAGDRRIRHDAALERE